MTNYKNMKTKKMTKCFQVFAILALIDYFRSDVFNITDVICIYFIVR